MTAWVCEDPDVIELVNTARRVSYYLWSSTDYDWNLAAELDAATGDIPIPEEES